jgi:hypothetical protein
MNNKSEQCFYYTFWGRHQGLIQAILIVIFFIPLPLWANILFGIPVQKNAVYLTVVVGALASIDSFFIDQKIQEKFRKIKLHEDGILSSINDKESLMRWDDVSVIEKIVFGDRDYYRVFGVSGIRIVNTSGEKLPIYKTINNYNKLVYLIREKIS